MNNTFSFNRFKNLLLKDGKMYIRNYGTSLIVWCFSTCFSVQKPCRQSGSECYAHGRLWP